MNSVPIFTMDLTHIFINTVTTMCEAPTRLLQNFESNFYFEGTWGRGSKPEYPEKTPDSLLVIRYHIRGENPMPRMGIEPSPSNIGDKLA